MSNPNDECDAREKRAFDSLAREVDAGEGVRRRIFEGLRRAGLLAPSRLRWRGAVAAAAALAVFAAGLAAGLWLSSNQGGEAPGQRYLLLLLQGDSAASSVPFEVAAEDMGRWVGELREQGRRISGAPLAAPGDLIPASSGEAPSLRPVGYFLFDAEDEAAASRLAASCPHVDHGGQVMLQRLRSR